MSKDEWIIAVVMSGRYSVSTNGEITSHNYYGNSGKSGLLKPRKLDSGYMQVALFDEHGHKEFCRVHRVVALIHIANVANLPYVNHKDGNKENNATSNLEWVTQSDNERHALSTGLKVPLFGAKNPMAKLDDFKIAEIRTLLAEKSKTQKEIGAMFGVNQAVISDINTGKLWREAA